MTDAFVAGAGIINFGELYEQSFDDLIEGAYLDLLSDVDRGVDPIADIDGIWYGTADVAGVGDSGVAIAHATGLFEKPATQVVNACSTGSDTFRNATQAIEAGHVDTALVIGAEKMLDDTGGLIERTAFGTLWQGRGVTMPSYFGLRATRHMDEYGTTREQIAKISSKNHENGSKYPYAHQQFRCSVEDVMDSPTVSYPMSLYDCCPVTDGACALLLASEETVDRYTEDPIRVAGSGLATSSFERGDDQALTHFPASRMAGRQAYQHAGIKSEDVDVAEVHDCFSITELVTYEDLGFCEDGAGGSMVDEGRTELNGDIPVNPSGGLLSKGHPIGATGVAQIAELYKQLRGESGNVQVDDPEIGLQHNIGIGRQTTGAVSCVNILRRP